MINVFRLLHDPIIVVSVGALAAWGCTSPKGAASGATLPTYEEGGAMTLSAQGQSITVPIDEALYNNTDSGYPDSIELTGPDTYIFVEVPVKAEDGPDGLSDYKPILNKGLLIKSVGGDDPTTLNMPGLGKYPIIAGTVTLQKYEHGMDGRVMWEGNVQFTVQTAAGPTPVSGTFKIGVVPVW